MLNTTSLLDQLNRQFGWVSRLENITQSTDGFLQVTTVRPEGSNLPLPWSPPTSRQGQQPPKVGQGEKEAIVCPPGCLSHNSWPRGWVPGLGAGVGASLALPALFPPLQVLSKAPNLEDPSAPPDTQVTVQLFDSEPVSLTVPGDISWNDPRFMEMVAEQALRHYKQNTV